jgi:branched-chain amino acid transport system substrate-binding protein
MALAVVLPSLTPASTAARSHAAHTTTLRLCESLPKSLPPLADLSRQISQAVKLATDEEKPLFSRAGVTLAGPLVLDYGSPTGASPTLEVQNAKACLARRDTFAYIGPINSGVAVFSERVLNRGGMVTISPSTTNADLTDPQARKYQEPAASRLGFVTFYRTVTTDNYQGPAAATLLQHRFHVRTYFLANDGSLYGNLLSTSFTHLASQLGLQEVGLAQLDITDQERTQRTADAAADRAVSVAPDAVYCACGFGGAGAVVSALRERGFARFFVGPDAIETPDWIQMTGQSAAVNSYATNPGLPPSRSAAWFRNAFRAKYGAAPTEYYDATAFDAAMIALRAMYSALTRHALHGSIQAQRETIVKLVAHSCYRGATGVTAFDRNGDTENRVISAYVSHGSQWRFLTLVHVGKAPACR